MSIPSNSVLRRILQDVVAGPVPPGVAPTERRAVAGQLLEVWRSAEVSRPQCPTSLHFWSHALRAFLDAESRVDAFGPLAGHCLCEAVSARSIGAAFASLGRRFEPAFEFQSNEGYWAGYRMIDQPEFVSWVAEREGEFVAVFWAESRWLARAQPLPIVPIEFIEPPD